MNDEMASHNAEQVLLNDITALKHTEEALKAARNYAEEQLRQYEELFTAIVDFAPVGVYVVDAQFRVKLVNARALPVFSEVEPLIGRDFAEVMAILWPPERARKFVEIFRHTLDTGEPYAETDFTDHRADLEVEQSYTWQLKRILLPNNEPGLVCYFNDITERRQAAEELEHISRSKDEFMAMLSHELRTPLTPVLMAAAMHERKASLAPEIRESFSMIHRNIKIEARLIDDMLDFSRARSGKLQIECVPADLHELLAQTAEIVEPGERENNASIVFDLAAPRHHAMADPVRMRQVFWNLVKNALKFTPNEGTVTLRTRNDDEGNIHVTVKDTGAGIPAAALDQIFNPFDQGEADGRTRKSGLGLGLSIAKAIVDGHQGTIRAESDGPGCGAMFTVALTAIDPPGTPPSDAPKSAGLRVPRLLRLLLVEDHEATRSVFELMIQGHGHTVVTAATTREALKAFSAEHFDAVISDLGLPDGDGIELMRKIQRRRAVPAVALSGYGAEDDVRRSKEAGFFAHFVKPVDMHQLQSILKQINERVSASAADEK